MSDLHANRNLILILARQFAAQLATAVFLVDADGSVIYYNEAAERLLGRRFVEGGDMTADEWFTTFRPRRDSGEHMPMEQLPIGVAIVKREPAHAAVTIRGADGIDRRIEATSFPLFAHTDDLVGAITFFWEQPT
ncbi:MAG TPA: PAS domain-containing protein [Actinomycetota bacterium]|nr:PAS domain-containing protein [Actinomycetota bacterium]